jgi:hypothetical protein
MKNSNGTIRNRLLAQCLNLLHHRLLQIQNTSERNTMFHFLISMTPSLCIQTAAYISLLPEPYALSVALSCQVGESCRNFTVKHIKLRIIPSFSSINWNHLIKLDVLDQENNASSPPSTEVWKI